jgi:chemotaxis methyl-accepting protein methylase
MVASAHDDGFAELTARIAAETGFACASYKERCLRRRLAVRMRARGVHTYADYARVLDGDAHEWERLLDALTINVTKLFRDRDAFAALAREVVPTLWREVDGPIRVWSAGCASGEEVYSLAALFHHHAESLGETGRLSRVSIVGTDIDRPSLAAAAAGRYPVSAFVDTPPELRARSFTPGHPAEVVPELRSLVRFERRDLLGDAPPVDAFDLILCRNVLIYFDRDTQERLFAAFRDALRPGGFLVLGKVETLLGDSRRGFDAVVARERVFRRVGGGRETHMTHMTHTALSPRGDAPARGA